LDSIHTESELFGLLAHEAGHVVLRHGSKRLLRNVLFAAMLSILLGDTQSLSGILLSQSSNLLELSYSRQEELEADQFALETLQIAGLDTHALPKLLKRLGSSSFEIPQVLSTHPSHAEREMLVQKVALPSSIKTYLSEQEWKSLLQTTSKNSSSTP
jgi:predicted Zn-dependent protease